MSWAPRHFDYQLPRELVAQTPAIRRDCSKLLVCHRESGDFEHRYFHELDFLLGPNDLLVINTTKVFGARLLGRKETGGKVEFLMTKQPTDNNQVVGLLRGRVKTGDEVVFKSLRGIITAKEVESGLAEIRFFGKPMEVLTVLAKEGLTPLPPYIQSPLSEKDRARRYQTVYARQPGSCAAPTAGLHFTPKLLKRIEDRGVQIAKINLQVGFGTFLPVRNENLLKRELHEEEYEIDYDNALLINTALSSRRRIVAVGTTTTRCLESAVFKRLGKDRVRNGRGITRLFIMPGYRFRVVSAMITNFHLPRSSLLYLVCAFASRPNTKADLVEFKSSLIGRAYQEAVLNEYRFYSFGDAMLIL